MEKSPGVSAVFLELCRKIIKRFVQVEVTFPLVSLDEKKGGRKC